MRRSPALKPRRTLTLVLHGESGSGKSWLADTSPGPRLIIDVEGGVRFTPSRKVPWDPREAPPELGPEDSAVVTATDLETMQRAYQWLAQGQHPFRSVVIDSLTEAQKRAVDAMVGTAQLKIQDYGTLLRKMEGLVRAFRDLTMSPVRPVEVVVFVTGTQEKGAEHPVMRPALLGRMAEQLAYYVDVQAYLAVQVGAEGQLERRALFAQIDGIAAKDRTGKLGVTMDAPSIPAMLDTIYGLEEE
jgi:hypothetical protein